MANVKTVEQVSWHRNGVAGVGFYAVLFRVDVDAVTPAEAAKWLIKSSDAEVGALFLGIVFDEPGYCAVINLDRVNEDGVTFGSNSWRGDRYEPELRAAIKGMESAGSVRVGPFGIPTGGHHGND
jgi:hypothetical protein